MALVFQLNFLDMVYLIQEDQLLKIYIKIFAAEVIMSRNL